MEKTDKHPLGQQDLITIEGGEIRPHACRHVY